ncbi:MAG: hypothetical protein LUH04_03685, partial [Clostridium sp.]|nr:hypothetical protein [Clostridium sp.]
RHILQADLLLLSHVVPSFLQKLMRFNFYLYYTPFWKKRKRDCIFSALLQIFSEVICALLRF